jgi:DNA-binding MarR family transcriptional regulator
MPPTAFSSDGPPVDGRPVLLVPTTRAEEMLNAFRQGRSEVMARALDTLSDDDRDRLAGALPALARLLDEVRSQEA